ncbi:MAG TPA: hypothetical protein VIM11_26440, partial [Tepidisphaeraceae bacterium]
PWDYPRWRRVLMQVVMWVVLAGSLGLAQLLARGRMNDRGNAVRMGMFEVRLPAEFKLDPSDLGTGLVARDDTGRRLFVTEAPMLDPGQFFSPRFKDQSPINFRGLGVMGVLEVRPPISGSGDTGGFLIASAPLPKIRRMIVVGLEVTGGEFDRDDEDLLARVAGGITLAKSKAGKAPTTRGWDSETAGQAWLIAN